MPNSTDTFSSASRKLQQTYDAFQGGSSMKDVTHHLKYVQKKVFQALRKTESSGENLQNGTKADLTSAAVVERPVLLKQKNY